MGLRQWPVSPTLILLFNAVKKFLPVLLSQHTDIVVRHKLHYLPCFGDDLYPEQDYQVCSQSGDNINTL